MQTISRLATFFAVVPSYDYINIKLSHKTLYRCYTIFIVFITIFYSMVSVYYRYMYRYNKISTKVMDFFIETLGLASYIVSALGSSFWNTVTWDKLIKELSQLERLPNSNTRGIKNTGSCLQHNHLTFVLLGFMGYVIVNMCNVYYVGWNGIVFHITQLVYHYIKFMFMIVLYTVTVSVRTKYEDLNRMLHGVNYVPITKKNVLKTIQKVRTLNLKLENIVETINSFFGWSIIFIFAHSLAEIVYWTQNLMLHNVGRFTLYDFISIIYMTGNFVSMIRIIKIAL